MEPFDLDRLKDIPDPFAGAAGAPLRAPPPKGMPASPSRAALRSERTIALVVAVVYEGLWLLLVEHRADLGVASRLGLAIGLGVPLGACVLALGAAMRGGGLGLGGSARRLAALAGASVAVFVVGTMMFAPADTEGARFWGHTLQCMAITCGLAAVPLALGVWAFRRSFVASSRWRGACLGAAAGGLAAATMSILCSTDGAAHVLLGHGVMIVVGGLAGAVFGERVMRA
jgi:hypothetical protein